MKKIKDFYLDENKWVGKAKVRKAIKDMREKLKKYKFKDEHGHPLELCVDYTNLEKEVGVNVR